MNRHNSERFDRLKIQHSNLGGEQMKARHVLLMLAISVVILALAAACAPAPTPVPTAAPPTAAPAQPTTAPAQPTTAPPPTSAPTAASTAPPATVAPKVGTPWKIGFISSATGGGASLGVPERDVANIVAAQLKAAGGIVGPDGVKHEVQILINDDQSSADTAATLARRLIDQDQVQVLVASTLTGTSLAIVPIATEAKVPTISMASSLDIIVDPKTKEVRTWIFKPVPGNNHSADKQAEYLKAVGVTKVCDLYSNDSYGQDTFASATASFTKAGIQIVYSDAFDPKATEFPQLAKVKSSGCDAVVIGAIPPGSSVMNVAVRDALPNIRIIHGHGSCSADLVKQAGKAAEGTVMPCGKILVADSLPDSDPAKALDLKLIKDYTDYTKGTPISTFAGHAYDALQWALVGLKALPDGGTLADQRAKVRDGIENGVKNFVTTHGLYTLSATDHLGFSGSEFAFVVVKDGKFVVLPKDQWK
jgi:branched-chain amino acid transport system substrate-binding protein